MKRLTQAEIIEVINHAREIIREEGEIHYSKLATLMGKSPTWAIQMRFVIADNENIIYEKGIFRWVGPKA